MLLARSRELMVEERRERTKAEWKKRSWAGSAGWLQRNVHLSEWERNSLWGEPFLKRNKTERSEAYKDLNDYLDVQFRLFREDFVFSLGDGIRSLTKKIHQRKNGLKTYTFTRVLRSWTRFVREQELAFHSSGHEKPQKDSMGAFQAITIWVIPLLFKGQHYKPCMLFATVANCKVEYLKSGRLDIRFLDSLEPVLSYGWVAIVLWAVSARFGTTEEYLLLPIIFHSESTWSLAILMWNLPST